MSRGELIAVAFMAVGVLGFILGTLAGIAYAVSCQRDEEAERARMRTAAQKLGGDRGSHYRV